MNDIAIRVEKLSKQYRIGRTQQRHDTLRDSLVAGLQGAGQRLSSIVHRPPPGSDRGRTADDIIWALRDISFEVKHGEVMGVIGRNGAGKSTLLKILSRITEPTAGRAEIYGRVGSLLEVGTGFHPELTGRENIYLSGAILGMRRTEIDRNFDEIAEFSGVHQFIDTPIKRYSSGMYVRLAFSVAAHLEPEILLVDEVLAVGDVAFQKKCLGKIDDVARQGRTVLFVSHNMGLIQSLCRYGVLLTEGTLTAVGSMSEVVDRYLQALGTESQLDLSTRTDRSGRGQVRLVGIQISDGSGSARSVLRTGMPARFSFDVSDLIGGMSIFVDVLDDLGRPITKFKSDFVGSEDEFETSGSLRFVCDVDELLLVRGRYQLDVLVRGGGEWQDFVQAAAHFDVEAGQLRGRPIDRDIKRPVSIVMAHRWTIPIEKDFGA